MPRRFLIDPEDHEIPSLDHYRQHWSNLPSTAQFITWRAKDQICATNQYFDFHRLLLDRVKHRHAEEDWQPMPLSLSVRAGALRAAVLIGVSVIEAAIRMHAEHRRIAGLGNKPTYGRVLRCWLDDPTHSPALAPVQTTLEELRDLRNEIHLYEAAQQEQDWARTLEDETLILQRVDEAIDFVQGLVS